MPSTFAIETSKTLHEPSIKQIIGFLRSSCKHHPLGVSWNQEVAEKALMMQTADNLERILAWKDAEQ